MIIWRVSGQDEGHVQPTQRAAYNSERERGEREGMQYDGKLNKSKRGNWVKRQLENINAINVVCRQR